MNSPISFQWSVTGILVFLLAINASAQAPVAKFRSGNKQFQENITQFMANPNIGQEEVMDDFYYRYVQFHTIPDLAQQEEIRASGLQLIEYVPDNTYLIAFPQNYQVARLGDFNVRSIVRAATEDKMDLRLTSGSMPDWALEGDKIRVILKAHPTTSRTTFINQLRQSGIELSKEDIHFPVIFAQLTINEVQTLAARPFVQYIEIGPAPAIKEDTGGRTLQRANLINSQITGGLRFDATGVNVMVRDDGAIGPHIDFEGRVFDHTGGGLGGTHGDGVAGVMAGAGNLDPTVEGGAAGANVYVLNYESTFTDNTIALHQSDNVVITNSSYSDGCNAGYTTTTQRVDQQMIDNPTLIHVFSGGNSNNNDCGYGAGNQWGNITGGHKMGKNVMATANLFADGTLVSSSSRGPAHDGRIKPDIAAHGQDQISTNPNNNYQSFGGTSAAAPTMAGSMAQLYQAYKSMNAGTDPEAALIKAIVLNTAFDKGNVGPDFKFGWGRIDAYRAYKSLSENTYLSGFISQGVTNMHNIAIPSGVTEARIMVYWTDPAAAVNTNKALVNDLNLTVEDPLVVNHLPWVLDPTPNATTLNLPATKGVDDLNNMEQVSILSPSAGNYTIKVNGNAIPMGSQKYYLVWTFLKSEILVTYPYGGEGFVPGETERIHWDAYGSSGTFNVSYSTDNGGTWNTIASGLSGTTRFLNWTVPGVVTEEALIRVTRGAKSDISDDNFSIIGLPSNLAAVDFCLGEAILSWNAVTGADLYRVYQLGEKYMEIIGETTGTSFQIPDLIPGEESWFAVQAANNDGVIGRRSDAISHTPDPGVVHCRNTIEFTKTASKSVANAGENIKYTLTLKSYYDTPITGVSITDEIGIAASYVANSLTCGSHSNGVISITAATINPDDSISCMFSVKTDIASATQVSFEDDMESGTGNWTIDNPRGAGTWSLSGANPNSPANSWFTPNTGTENNTQYIISSPQLITAGNRLSFFHEYNTESGWDGGIVEISTDNGANWIDLAPYFMTNGYNGGLGSGSNPDIANRAAFTGSSGGYIETIADLSSFDGQILLVRFIFGEDDNTTVTGWYVDDISIRIPFYQVNTACGDYDQGDEGCDMASTLMLPCQQNCGTCTDNILNGSETDVDCGGPVCGQCLCTNLNNQLTYSNVTIPDGTVEKVEGSINTTGLVFTAEQSNVEFRAGEEVSFESNFTMGNNAELLILMEACSPISGVGQGESGSN